MTKDLEGEVSLNQTLRGEVDSALEVILDGFVEPDEDDDGE